MERDREMEKRDERKERCFEKESMTKKKRNVASMGERSKDIKKKKTHPPLPLCSSFVFL